MRLRFLLMVSMPFLGMLFLSSCDNREVDVYKGQVETLRKDFDSERDKREGLEKQNEQMARDTARLKAQFEDAQKDREKLEDALKKLDKEFSEYKEKYKVSISRKVPGYPLGEFVFNKRTYQDTQVRAVEDDTITLSHPEGLLRLKKSELTAEMVGTFAMDQSTPVQMEVPALLRLVEDHKNGKLSTAVNSEFATGGLTGSSEQLGSYAAVLKSVALVQVKVDGGTGFGTGFVATQKGHTYFFSNAHVMDGASPKAVIPMGPGHVAEIPLPKEMEISDEDDAGDIVRFELKNSDITPLKILEDSDKLLPGQEIMALGNSGGAGVIPCIRGKTGGVGPYWLETNVATVHGNSGGPVIWLGTKTVVGIVTAFTVSNGGDRLLGATMLPGAVSNGPRRVCIRPEKIEKWKRVNADRVFVESTALHRIDTDTEILETLRNFHITTQENYIYSVDRLPPKFYSFMKSELANNIGLHVRQLETDLKGVQRAYEETSDKWKSLYHTDGYRLWAEAKNRATLLARQGAKQHFAEFVASVNHIYGADVTGVGPKGYTAFHRKTFEGEAKQRQEVIDYLNKHFEEEFRQFDFNSTK